MKTFLLVLTASLALSVADHSSEELIPADEIKGFPLAIQARSLSSRGKDALENFMAKLPCGWPEAGIPPLAPYTKEQLELKLNKSFAEIFAKFEHFRVDGLDILLINKLKINYAFSQKVQFNLVLPKVVISGRLIAGAIVDFMKDYGISLQYDGNGDFELVLENITFQGKFKYTMPFIWGSIKIYKFDGSLTLGNVISQINGVAGEGKFKKLLNDQIEDILMKTYGINQDKINGMLVNDLVPYLNSKLKGRKIWSLIRSAFGKNGKICYPPADPWALN